MTNPIPHSGKKAQMTIRNIIEKQIIGHDFFAKWEDYTPGEVKFAEDRKNHPQRKMFVDEVISNKYKSVLEIGAAELYECEEILKQKPDINYTVVDVSKVFLDSCRKRFPNVNTVQSPMELLDLDKRFDVAYLCQVLEHSYDIKLAIRNILTFCRNFHFVLFKWSFTGDLIPNWVVSHTGQRYWTSYYNIWKILREIGLYAKVNYAKVCLNTGELIDLDEAAKYKYTKGIQHVRGDGVRLIIKGKTYAEKEFPYEEKSADEYNAHWKRKPRHRKGQHVYVSAAIDLCKEFYPNPTNVLEIGAGTGAPAKRFIDNLSPNSYTLNEFSNSIFEMTPYLKDIKNCETHIHNANFQTITKEQLSKYDLIVALEILEHINGDIEFLSKLKSGTWVILSVPAFQAVMHVRAFQISQDILNRYGSILDIKKIMKVYAPKGYVKWRCAIGRRI